jgi:Leucine-rich repeat (LRR) protein
MKKYLPYILFFYIISILSACNSSKDDSQTLSKEETQQMLAWIDDQVNYFTAEDKKKIASQLADYQKNTRNMVRVVVINDFSPLPTMGQYLRKYAQDNKFSTDSTFMLIGLAINRGTPDVFPNWRMKRMISQKEIDDIMRIIVNDWANQELYKGIENTISYLNERGTMLGETFLQMSMPAYSLEQALEKPDSTYRLDLRGQNLKNFPTEIFKLKNLGELWLNKNQIKEIPLEIAQLEHLQSIDLSNNQINSLPESFKNLKNLRKLNLNKNLIKDGVSTIALISYLPKLVSLEMNFCQMDSLSPQIGNFLKINDLQFTGNQLKYLPAEIGKLKKLQILVVNKNLLKTLPSQIGDMEQLQLLYADSNQVAFIPPQISNLNKLLVLRLHKNQLTTLPTELGKLQNLQRLYLADNQLINISEVIKNLPQLQDISIIRNPISEEEKKRINLLFPKIKTQ